MIAEYIEILLHFELERPSNTLTVIIHHDRPNTNTLKSPQAQGENMYGGCNGSLGLGSLSAVAQSGNTEGTAQHMILTRRQRVIGCCMYDV
eukprot:scaffold21541_cov134-Skeletonema_marinoi.AAC.3